MTTNLEKVFKALDLSPRAQQIFELVGKGGPISASQIATELHLPRATVYLDLAALQTENLIVATGRSHGQKFLPAEFENLPAAIKRRAEEFQALATIAAGAKEEMQEIFSTANIFLPTIRFFRGLDGVRRALDLTLTAKEKKVYGLVPSGDFFAGLNHQFLKSNVQERVRRGIHVYNVWSGAKKIPEFLLPHANQLRELRIAPAGFDLKSAIFIFDKTVIVITSMQERMAIVVNSRDLAESMRLLFRLAWEKSTAA